MKEMTLEELQQVEFDLLDVFANFCDKHGLTYFLAYGTLIGAARHRGFIPWDDDIDVMMPRPDYEKFLELYVDSGRYVLKTHDRDSSYFYPFAKLVNSDTKFIECNCDESTLGVFVDIFPLDGVPTNKIRQRYRALKWRVLRVLTIHGFNVESRDSYLKNNQRAKWIISNIAGTMAKPFKFSSIDKAVNSLSTVSDYENFEMAYCCWQTYSFNSVPKKWFRDYALLPFGDKEYKVHVGWDEWNTHIYGDYMTPPEHPDHSHGKGYWK